jgi:SAM-dependent methyltransferase
MKTVLLVDHYVEADVKPGDMLDTYAHLAERDYGKLAAERALASCPCPGCGAPEGKAAFERFGAAYLECPNCQTLWVSPRPGDADIADYYAEAEAEAYWRNELSRATSEARLKRIIVPRFDWVTDSTQQYLPTATCMVDYGTHHEAYARALAEFPRFEEKTLLNPICPIDAAALGTEVSIVTGPAGSALDAASVDAVTLFEVLDRSADADALMAAVHRMLRPGGLAFVTGILSSGFDIMTLWDRAPNIFPPDRLNVFSVEGLTALAERHDFEVLEFSTPGMFDAATVAQVLDTDGTAGLHRFIAYMVRNRGEEGRQRLQEFLQTNLLSSYGRMLIRRKST